MKSANRAAEAESSPAYAYKLETGPVALYAQLAAILRERIKSGEWANGSGMPTLEDLAAQFSVARITVRQAMQILVKEGLVSSQRGRRTLVTYSATRDKTPLFVSIDLVSSVTPDYKVTVLSRDTVSASYLGSPFYGTPRGQYMRFRKVDHEGGLPYSTSTHFIAKAIYNRFPPGADAEIKIARLVRDKARAQIVECRERVTVGASDLDESQQLECPFSAPVARINRVFLDAHGDILYCAMLTFRSDRFGIERDITGMIKP